MPYDYLYLEDERQAYEAEIIAQDYEPDPQCGQCGNFHPSRNPKQPLGLCPMGFMENEWGELEDYKLVRPNQNASECHWYDEVCPF